MPLFLQQPGQSFGPELAGHGIEDLRQAGRLARLGLPPQLERHHVVRGPDARARQHLEVGGLGRQALQHLLVDAALQRLFQREGLARALLVGLLLALEQLLELAGRDGPRAGLDHGVGDRAGEHRPDAAAAQEAEGDDQQAHDGGPEPRFGEAAEKTKHRRPIEAPPGARPARVMSGLADGGAPRGALSNRERPGYAAPGPRPFGASRATRT